MDLDNITTLSSARCVWFYVDVQFYLRECVKRGIALDSSERNYIVNHYLEFGGRHRLSPNPFFDEERYRKRYGWVADDIARGRCRSGFDHYLKNGRIENASPHWLFDPAWYRSRNPDVTERTLERKRCYGPTFKCEMKAANLIS